MCALTHLAVGRIPSRYVLKRYTKDPIIETAFDRHDKMFLGPNGDTKARRTRSILSELFRFQRSAVMSEQAMQKAREILENGIAMLDKIPQDISVPIHHAATSTAAPTSSFANNTEGMAEQESASAPPVSASAPPVSTTKGSRKNSAVTGDIPQPHFQRDRRKKSRRCGRCGLYDTGHNAATCERAQQELENVPIKRPRGRPRGSGRGRGIEKNHENATTEQEQM